MTEFEVEDQGLKREELGDVEDSVDNELIACKWEKWSWEEIFENFSDVSFWETPVPDIVGSRSSKEEMLLSRRKMSFTMCHSNKIQQELIIEMKNPNVTSRIIWHVNLFTTELRHTCSSLLFLSK